MADYFDAALTSSNRDLTEIMRTHLKGVRYDTIIGTGLSGTIFTARVAPALHKNFAIVRKADDRSTHSDARIEGKVGERFVFADDFVLSGITMKHVLTMMDRFHPDSAFMGVYEYQYTPRFTSSDQAIDRFSRWVFPNPHPID